ncbi:hypothetical protein [Propionivibrio sp.]|uniref:hypothetical protein n=1 Tax=Propionivibrio sp. TaxID=2212460 RepID=UPI003BF1A664
MENWITRIVALMCAGGSTALFWMVGVFVAVPWREGRMLSLATVELQVIIIPLLLGLAVAWGALHIFAIADRDANPMIHAAIRVLLVIAAIAAIIGGMSWTQANFV